MADAPSPPPMRNPFLIGEQVYLRPIEEADAARCYEWFSDPEVRFQLGRAALPNTEQASLEFIRGVDGATRQMFAIVVRADGSLPDSPALHKYLLAYASDFSFIGTALQPHGVSSWSKFIQLASLDHAIWFHREVKMDDWLLYSIDSPWAGNARGFARGSIFNRQGELVASVAQEGLIRVREDWM